MSVSCEPHRRTATAERQATSAPVKPAFEDFFRAELPRLIVFLVYLSAPVAVVEDIAQEVMIEAYRQWAEIKNPRAWVRTVASRTWGRRACTPVTTCELTEDSPAVRAEVSPLEQVLSSEQYREAIAAIQRLPPRQAQVMAWTYDGFRPQEIAEILGITAEDVRANLYKARQTLKTSREAAS